MASLSQLQTWLTEAEEARHKLALGDKVVEVMRAGRKMRFTQASLEALTVYIAQLQSEIEQAQAEAAGKPRRQAIGTYF